MPQGLYRSDPRVRVRPDAAPDRGRPLRSHQGRRHAQAAARDRPLAHRRRAQGRRPVEVDEPENHGGHRSHRRHPAAGRRPAGPLARRRDARQGDARVLRRRRRIPVVLHHRPRRRPPGKRTDVRHLRGRNANLSGQRLRRSHAGHRDGGRRRVRGVHQTPVRRGGLEPHAHHAVLQGHQ